MKKISLFALALVSSLAMFAQDNNNRMTTPMAKKVYWGVKAGVNLAEFRVDNVSPEPDLNMKTSINGGFLVNIPLKNKLYFQPELIYSGQGSKVTPSAGPSYEQDLSYIALPLMFQIKSNGGFFVEVGPQPGYLVRAQSEVGSTTTKNRGNFDKFDVALNGGIGYTSRVGLGVNARYSLGLTNTYGLGDGPDNNGPEYKNSGIQFSLFYLFGAHK